MKKISFLNNIGLFLGARESILNKFRSKAFTIKNTIREQAPEQPPEIAPKQLNIRHLN